MSDFDFPASDDLSQVLSAAPRSNLPSDPSFVRIREAQTGVIESCPKCRGTGMTRWGACFACKGRGSKTYANSAPVRAANREKVQARKERAQATNWTTFVELHSAEAEVLVKGIAQTWGDGRWQATCADIKAKVEKYGDLHEGTLAMLGRAVARDQERAAQRAQTTAQVAERVAGVDVANIVDCFQRAQTAGLKRFTLRFADAHFQVDKHDKALIWLSRAGYGTEKYGRIVGGMFKPGRDATDAVIARIVEISKDPMAAAKAYAQLTSNCSVCGLHLENQDSVDAGIGPICAGRLNRPGLKFVEVKEGDF